MRMLWNDLLSSWWLVPVMGTVAAFVTFLAGRNLLHRSSAGPDAPGKTPGCIPGSPLNDPFVEPPPSERRHATRRAGNAVDVELLDPDGNLPAVCGWVVNRSLGGLCLEVETAVAVGAIRAVRVRKAPSQGQPLEVEVKSCRPAGPAWQLGCTFCKSPSFNTLLMFG